MSSAAATPGWRKRHPVLARALLYGVGGVLFGGLLWAFSARQQTNRQDHVEYLRKRFENLDLIYVQDVEGREVLKVLDAEYSDPSLPADLRQRALRARGMALARGGMKDLAERAFSDADAISAAPREKGALLVEWGEIRTKFGDTAGGASLLARSDSVRDGPLGLLTTTALAYARSEGGDTPAASKMLEDALAALPTPLPAHAADRVGLREYTYPQAALQATEYVLMLGRKPAAGAWKRLGALAPDNFEIQTAVARALEGEGLHEDAQAAWKAACACDPEAAARHAAKDPALKALGR